MNELLWLRAYTGEETPKVETLPFSTNYVYRVFYSFTDTDPVEKREDILAPSFSVVKRPKKKAELVNEPCFRLFYQGAEEEVTRFVLWLRTVYLAQDTDEQPPIYLGCQPTYLAQSELETQYPDMPMHFIGPNELEHYGLLSGFVSELDDTVVF